MEDCEEPGCSRTASKIWFGRKLCSSHYTKYKDEYEQMLIDIEDL